MAAREYASTASARLVRGGLSHAALLGKSKKNATCPVRVLRPRDGGPPNCRGYRGGFSGSTGRT
eukprot:12073621-Alexandrium_andersonii.AAC.1